MKKRSTIVCSLMFIFLALGVAGCEQQGSAEKAGEKIDTAMENISNSAKEAVETVGDKVEEAGDKIEEQTDKASN